MNSMEKLRRINEKYDQGLMDAVAGTYKPGFTFGIFKRMYRKGHSQGCKIGCNMRRLTDFKTK